MKTEKVLTSIFILALLAYFFNIPGHSLLLIVSLGILSFLYFPLAFYFYSDKTFKQRNVVLSVLGGMVLSIIPMGILFKLLTWPGYHVQLGTALVLTPILLVNVLFLSRKANEDTKTYYKNYMTRIIFWFTMCVAFHFISTVTLIKIKYRDDPELVRLKLQSFENPDNTEYYNAIDNYNRQKDSIAFANETDK